MAKMKSYWTCTNCHEQVDFNYEVCWKCQYDREGNPRVDLVEGVRIDDPGEREALAEKHKDKQCIHCKIALEYRGSKRFHEGTQWGVFGDIGELFERRVELEMYSCLRCRRVEFFYFEPS